MCYEIRLLYCTSIITVYKLEFYYFVNNILHSKNFCDFVYLAVVWLLLSNDYSLNFQQEAWLNLPVIFIAT